MRTKVEVIQEHYGTRNIDDIYAISSADFDPMTTPRPPLDHWIKMKLPYEAPGNHVIRSIEEIDKGMQENRLTQSGGLFAVCKVGKYVVKMGADRIILQEAENLLYLQEHSQVRVPKVYSAFVRPYEPFGICYLVTEFIEGETLNPKTWEALDNRAQHIICSKLSEQLKLLRSIPSEGYYGRLHRQGWSPWIPFLRTHGKDMCGPYYTFNDFLSAMYTTAELCQAKSDRLQDFDPRTQEFLLNFKQMLGRTSDEDTPVLTHMDPKFQNIIITPVFNQHGERINDWEVTLIDWDSLGWLPSFMQFAIIRASCYPEHEQSWTRRIFANFEETYVKEVEFVRKSIETVFYTLCSVHHCWLRDTHDEKSDPNDQNTRIKVEISLRF